MENKWIPVAERLPEYDVPVIVITADGGITAAILRFEDTGWVWEEHGMGFLDEPSSYEMDDDYQYTHWQPLPEPPEDE